MLKKDTKNALLSELIDHLLYPTKEKQKWKDRLCCPISDRWAIPGILGVIVREGIAAGVSKPLAHAVVLQYAESESVDLPAEKIAGIVEGWYENEASKQEEKRKKEADGGKN